MRRGSPGDQGELNGSVVAECHVCEPTLQDGPIESHDDRRGDRRRVPSGPGGSRAEAEGDRGALRRPGTRGYAGRRDRGARSRGGRARSARSPREELDRLAGKAHNGVAARVASRDYDDVEQPASRGPRGAGASSFSTRSPIRETSGRSSGRQPRRTPPSSCRNVIPRASARRSRRPRRGRSSGSGSAGPGTPRSSSSAPRRPASGFSGPTLRVQVFGRQIFPATSSSASGRKARDFGGSRGNRATASFRSRWREVPVRSTSRSPRGCSSTRSSGGGSAIPRHENSLTRPAAG